ncbi:MAG: heavy-metal-associated domain-containing protein [Patescibacteria group bacterium]
MTKQTFKISGMHCVACALNIDMDLEEVPGVKNSQTNYARQETAVEFDNSKISPEIIKSTIAKTGYKVVD